MRTLQGPGRDNEPDPFASLVKQIADLRRGIDDATAQVLRMAGLRAEPDLLRVLGSLVVEGDLSVPSGVINLAGVDQDVASAIDAIAALISQQVAVDASTASTGTVTLTTTLTDYATVSLAVPSGYTRALVLGVTALVTGATSAVETCTRINGSDGTYVLGLQTSGAWNLTATSVRSLTGLSGGSITVASRAHMVSGSGPSTVLITSAMATFLR